MADKSFKIKSGLVVPALSTAGIVKTDSSGNISSSAVIPISEGGTGQTTAGNALNALLPLQTGQDNKYLQTNGVSTQWNAITGFKPEVNSAISTNQTLVSGYRYFVDTTAVRTLTLPANPNVGDEIQVYDASGLAATNNITVSRNGKLINGNAGNFIIDLTGGTYSLVYTGSSYGWTVK